LHHGSDGVGLDADSKFTTQDRMRSKKTESAHLWLPDRYAKTLFFNGFPDIFEKIHQALSKEAE